MKKINTPDKLDKLYTLDRLSTLFFYLAILIFIIGFNFTDSPPPSGWYQQFMPNLGGRQISDITFLDSLMGYATAYTTTDTNYVLKTSNGGDNWSIVYKDYHLFNRVQFLSTSIGYVCGAVLVKTTNGGMNWFNINTSGVVPENMYVLNQDTIWITYTNSLAGGVFRTTNGGQNWDQQLSLGNLNPDHIYMLNGRIGFISRVNSGAPYVRKTTNGGQNWDTIVNNEAFTDIYFIDSLTGWRTFGSMKKTTDGGLNWQTQIMPHGGNIITSTVSKFSNVNKDTIWGVGGYLQFPNYEIRGIIYKTINNGDNWGFQLPDTSIHIGLFNYVKFTSKLIGWVYSGSPGVHTIIGGDTVWYTGIVQKSTEVPADFVLKQNYPNPFNPRTVIPYSLKSAGYVRIIAYDILGREVQRLVDRKQSAGEYEVDFMGKFCSSGVYFYRMTVDGNMIGTRTMVLLK